MVLVPLHNDRKASVLKHLYGYDALSDELKMFSDGMENDLTRHVKELSKRFLSEKAIGAIAPSKSYESNFIHHDFVQFGKQHSQFKAILPPLFSHSNVVMYTSSPLQ